MKIILSCALFAILAASFSSRARAASDAPVGMAASVTGDVSVVQGGQKRPLRLLGRLHDGAQLVTGRGAGAVIVLFGLGRRFVVGAGQKATVSATGIAGARALPALAGPSQRVVKMLGQARVGAALARNAPSFQRLSPGAPGYFVGAPTRFEWQPIAGAATQNWTLFDGADNVIWSAATPQNFAAYPPNAPALLERRPYLWKLSGFGATGKPLIESRWGIVTLLSPDDARDMEAAAVALMPAPGAAPETIVEALLLQSEVYRSFGALNRALEILDDARLRDVAGLSDARGEITDSLSPFARTLARASLGLNP